MNTMKLLTIVIVLQSLILAGQWLGGGYVSPASAQIPDAGSQRLQMLEELRSINGKMDRLMTTLEKGHLQVRVATPDEER